MANTWRLGDDNREEIEVRLFTSLQDKLSEKMPGYVIALEFTPNHHDVHLEITSPELQVFLPTMKAKVSWRYRKTSFWSDWKRREVIGVRAEYDSTASENYRRNTRNYGFDFKNECMKPDTFQKLVAFLKGETEAKIHRCKTTGQNKQAQKELFMQAVAKLKTAGYAITTSQQAMFDDLIDRDIPFQIVRPNGGFSQSMKVLTTGRLGHKLGDVDLKDVANFVGCLEQTLRYVK